MPVHELGSLPDGRPFFTMKLVEGRTLAELLQERRDPTHDLPRFLTIFEQVCQALGYAHSQRVIHRDLKPANVMVGAFGEVQVMDWGLAKILPQARADGPRREGLAAANPASPAMDGSDTLRFPPAAGERVESRMGQAMGTPAFMPPEQARGEIERMEERADVFGLGGILCVILTGQPPYAGTHSADVYGQAARGELGAALLRLDGCGADADLVRLCQDCLALDPAARPRDARVVAGRMTAYLAGVQERLRQAELERAAAQVKAAEERKRRRLAVGLAAAVLALVLLAAGGGAWFLQQRAELRRGTESALVTSAGLRGRGPLERGAGRARPGGESSGRHGIGRPAAAVGPRAGRRAVGPTARRDSPTAGDPG